MNGLEVVYYQLGLYFPVRSIIVKNPFKINIIYNAWTQYV